MRKAGRPTHGHRSETSKGSEICIGENRNTGSSEVHIAFRRDLDVEELKSVQTPMTAEVVRTPDGKITTRLCVSEEVMEAIVTNYQLLKAGRAARKEQMEEQVKEHLFEEKERRYHELMEIEHQRIAAELGLEEDDFEEEGTDTDDAITNSLEVADGEDAKVKRGN